MERVGSKKLDKKKEEYAQYMQDFQIFNQLRGQQHGVQYTTPEGLQAKVGSDTTYRIGLDVPMDPDKQKLQLGLSQKFPDGKVYGDVSMKQGLDPVGRVGVKYTPFDGTGMKVQAYNYDDTRESLAEKATIEASITQKMLSNLYLKAKASHRPSEGGIKDYKATINYKNKF